MALYDSHLRAALDVAQEAGDLLRREFHRPGGPRGHGSKADADEEAEWVIRRRLLEAFPGIGYRGEETGTVFADDPHIWLVDPNDGTSSFLRGKRGSSVSIALLCDRVPVLGVVYAYAAPDDKGDLFAWAEGLDLTRNGLILQSLPDAMDPNGALLLCSSHHPNVTESLIACIRPYRYRTVPSIAYRLALAAAGDGAAALSWHRPGDWDYAAGHALLHAAGGIFLDETGAPIVYASDGSSKCRRCFGGIAGVVRDIQKRDWDAALHRQKSGDSSVFYFPSARLEPGNAIEDFELLSRAQGCLLGQIAGDALGQLVEFVDAESIRNSYPAGLRLLKDGGTWNTLAGQPTDDSEMALMLARSILQNKKYDRETVAAAYQYWFHESAPFDFGGTTKSAIGPVSMGDVQRRNAGSVMSTKASRESQSNGSLMRISPLGVYGYLKSESDLWSLAEGESRLTHPNEICCQCCSLFVSAIADLVRTGNTSAETYQNVLSRAEKYRVNELVLDSLKKASTSMPNFQQHMGWVLIAFQNAFFQLLHAGNLEEGVVNTVMQGGDTDTNAAIAGALLGAAYGREGIPLQWRQMVLSCRMHDAAGARHPRPRPFWPIDVLEIAEGLLLCGRDGLRNT